MHGILAPVIFVFLLSFLLFPWALKSDSLVSVSALQFAVLFLSTEREQSSLDVANYGIWGRGTSRWLWVI